jgi:DNA-binding GntR family transcriptional regulator
MASAYEQIRRGIVEGRYRPGERLVEQRIAEELDLSRTPVREAFRMLQSEGLVEVQPNRGVSVRGLTVDAIGDLYELRARLEAMAAEGAATRATADDLAQLTDAEAEFAAAVSDASAGDVRAVFTANEQFHRAVVAAAHHDRLAQALARTVDDTLVFQAFRHYRPVAMARSVLFHQMIAEAIRHREAERAGRLVHEHVLQGRDQLLVVVGDSPSVDALYDAVGQAKPLVL